MPVLPGARGTCVPPAAPALLPPAVGHLGEAWGPTGAALALHRQHYCHQIVPPAVGHLGEASGPTGAVSRLHQPQKSTQDLGVLGVWTLVTAAGCFMQHWRARVWTCPASGYSCWLCRAAGAKTRLLPLAPCAVVRSRCAGTAWPRASNGMCVRDLGPDFTGNDICALGIAAFEFAPGSQLLPTQSWAWGMRACHCNGVYVDPHLLLLLKPCQE